MQFDPSGGYIQGVGFTVIEYKSPALPKKWSLHGDAIFNAIGTIVSKANGFGGDDSLAENPPMAENSHLLLADNQNRQTAFSASVRSQYKETDQTKVKTKTRYLKLPVCPDSSKQLGGSTAEWQGPNYKTRPDAVRDSMKLTGVVAFVINEIDVEGESVDVPFFFKVFEFPVSYHGQQLISTMVTPKKQDKPTLGFAAALAARKKKEGGDEGEN